MRFSSRLAGPAVSQITPASENKYTHLSTTVTRTSRARRGNDFLSLYRSAVGLVVFPQSGARDRVTGGDKVRRTQRDRRDKITNSSIRRVVKCKCMRVPPPNVLGELFLHACIHAHARTHVRVRVSRRPVTDSYRARSTRSVSRKVVRPEPNGCNNFNC